MASRFKYSERRCLTLYLPPLSVNYELMQELFLPPLINDLNFPLSLTQLRAAASLWDRSRFVGFFVNAYPRYANYSLCGSRR